MTAPTTSAPSREEFEDLIKILIGHTIKNWVLEVPTSPESADAQRRLLAAYDALVEERDTWASQCDEMGRALRSRP